MLNGLSFIWPIDNPPNPGDIPAGYRYGAPRSNHIHQGLDMGNAVGQIVYASARGVVYQAYSYTSYGGPGIIDIDHGVDASGATWRTRYLHVDPSSFSQFGTAKGAEVAAGQPIAQIGSISGPHLHFEVRRCLDSCPIWYSGWEHFDPLEILLEGGSIGGSVGPVLLVAAVGALAYFFITRR